MAATLGIKPEQPGDTIPGNLIPLQFQLRVFQLQDQ